MKRIILALAMASASALASASAVTDLAVLAAGGSLAPVCDAKCGPLITTSEFMKVCHLNSDFTGPDRGECAIRMMLKQEEISKCWMQVLRSLAL